MKSNQDYYQMLGIQKNASMEDIRRAYRLYASKFHPDKHDGDIFFEERFKEINEAYDTLSDESKRMGYDIKKFGKSKVVRRYPLDDGSFFKNVPSGKLRFEVSHLDVYLTLVYLINLATWIMVKRLNANASTGGHIVCLFLCGMSTLGIWIFITKVIEARNQRKTSGHSLLVGYLLVALLVGGIPIATNWIP